MWVRWRSLELLNNFEFRILSQELKIWQEFAVFILFGTVTSSDKNVRVVPLGYIILHNNCSRKIMKLAN